MNTAEQTMPEHSYFMTLNTQGKMEDKIDWCFVNMNSRMTLQKSHW